MCRRQLSKEAVGTGAYLRAKAVAEAAESSLGGVTGLSAAFLAAAVGQLWQTAFAIGMSSEVSSSVLAKDRQRADKFSKRSAECSGLESAAKEFEVGFVKVWEEQATRIVEMTGDLQLSASIFSSASVEILQRRCAVLAEEARTWETDVPRLRRQKCFRQADQLLHMVGLHLSQLVDLSSVACLPEGKAREHFHEVEALRATIASERAREVDLSSDGGVEMPRQPDRPLTPFGACLGWTSDRSAIPLSSLRAMRSVVATARSSGQVDSQGLIGSHGRKITEASRHLIDALLRDRLVARVVGYLTSSNRSFALIVVSLFQQLLHCGQESRQVVFTYIDPAVGALAAQRNRTDDELRASLCSLVHDLIFKGGCEERMALRLQREEAPREATTMEEWFLDTLLVQNDAVAFRDDIVLANHTVDPWLCGASGYGGSLLGVDSLLES